MSKITNKPDRYAFLPYIIGGLSFIPLCGVPFGLVSLIWGLLSKKPGKVLALVGSLGIILTIVIYGSLYYFGFIQRGGVYDSLRVKLAKSELTTLVKSIEFYKLQNGSYPSTLKELSASQPQGQSVSIYDPTLAVSSKTLTQTFFYQLTKDGSGYYLLGIGVDKLPFTSDDLLPEIDTKNTGLLINPASKPK